MHHRLRKEFIYNTVPKLNEQIDFIKIDNIKYKISPDLDKRIKIKNIVAPLPSIIIIVIGLYTMDTKFSILAKDTSSDNWKLTTVYIFEFLGIILIQFVLINNLFIPKNLNTLNTYVIKEK